MAPSDDDEDMKRAIALSLQDEATTSRESRTAGQSFRDAIALDSETEDEDEPREISKMAQEDAVRKDKNSLRTSLHHHAEASVGKSVESEPSVSTSSLSFFGIDRKKMEQERLARKRKASTSPPPPRKAPRVSPNIPVESRTLFSQSTTNTTSQVIAEPKPTSERNSSVEIRVPRGTVKKTWAFGHSRTGDDIKLEEVLQKNDLNSAVLSSFQWDMGWLLAKINTRSTQITLVMQAKDEATKQQFRRETVSMPNLRLCFPSMEGQVNCMHSKLMLLSHPTHLRVAVPTANLVPYDWGESGDMENMVFLIDLPRLPDSKRTAPEDLTFFGRELIYFLEAMGLERSIINSTYNFDFAATKDLAFVHTIGGAHAGEDDPWKRTGYCGLGRAVQELGLAAEKALKIDFVTSSVGSLNIDFLAMLYLAAQGDDGSTEYQWRNPVAAKGKSKQSKAAPNGAETAQKKLKDHIRENFHIYFPTHETVKSSTAGSAGTICFQSKWYNSAIFPRQAMRDCKSTRIGLLMHNKIIYVRRKGEGDSTSWAYIGSANCSESAWGKLFKDRASKSPKLNCRNWECGVLVPVCRVGREHEHSDLRAFEGTIPVPMQHPGQPYGNRKPWYYSEQ